MTLIIDIPTNTISCFSGDTGNIHITGLPVDKDYFVYFEVRDIRYNNVNASAFVKSLYADNVTIPIGAEFTDKLTTPNGAPTEYRWGVKLCDDVGTEDTVEINNIDVFSDYPFMVYPKKVEGQ